MVTVSVNCERVMHAGKREDVELEHRMNDKGEGTYCGGRETV